MKTTSYIVLFSKGIYNVAKYFKYTFYIIKYHLTSASSIVCWKYSYQAKVLIPSVFWTLGAFLKADSTASKSHKLAFQILIGSNGWNMTYDPQQKWQSQWWETILEVQHTTLRIASCCTWSNAGCLYMQIKVTLSDWCTTIQDYSQVKK